MRKIKLGSMLVLGVLAFVPAVAVAQDTQWFAFSGSQQDQNDEGDATYEEPVETYSETSITETTTTGWEKPLPLSLSLEYTLVSDYIFRGINFSEHRREGRETPNHQLLVSLSTDVSGIFGGPAGQCGEIGFDAWFEWYGDQDKITGDGANIQQIDYTVWLGFEVEQIATDVTLGWIAKTYQNLRGTRDDRTNEWFFALEHNDAWLWRGLGYQGDDGVLNPSLTLYHDMHMSGGVWVDLGMSHGFELVEHLTVTPSYTLHIDGGWLGGITRADDHDTRIAGMTWGLNVGYELTELLRMPEWAGSMTLSGFLNYFNPTSNVRSSLGPAVGMQDELWGGMTLAWNW